MRLLLIALNFTPEPLGVGRCTGRLAAALAAHGHEVRVVTAPPHYPEWRIDRRYGSWRWRQEMIAGVRVLRCPLWVPGSPGGLRRVIHLLSFVLSSLVPTLWLAVRWRPEVVWTVEPTALVAPAVLLAARLAGARACLHVQDLQIEAAVSLGLLTPAMAWPARRLHAALVRRFDLVSTLSEPMRCHLLALGVRAPRLCLFPNGVDTEAIRPPAGPGRLREALGLEERTVVLYAGQMGLRQGLELLGPTLDLLASRPDIVVVLCGAGAAQPQLTHRFAARANVRLLPLQPDDRLSELLGLADIHILPQRAGAERFSLPSKLAGMLASGRPVIVQSGVEGEVAVIGRCFGRLVPPGDAPALAAAIRELADDPTARARLGAAARAFAVAHWDWGPLIADYERRLIGLAHTAPMPLPAAARGQRADA